jgi:hypothetical protein
MSLTSAVSALTSFDESAGLRTADSVSRRGTAGRWTKPRQRVAGQVLLAADAVAVAVQVVLIRPYDADGSGVDRSVSTPAFDRG